VRKPKVRLPAILSALVTVAGILSLPEVLALLPKDAAVTVVAIGAALQAITKPVTRKEHER